MRKYTHFITASNFFKNSTLAKQQFIIDKMSRCARDTHSSHVFLYSQISRDFFFETIAEHKQHKTTAHFSTKGPKQSVQKKSVSHHHHRHVAFVCVSCSPFQRDHHQHRLQSVRCRRSGVKPRNFSTCLFFRTSYQIHLKATYLHIIYMYDLHFYTKKHGLFWSIFRSLFLEQKRVSKFSQWRRIKNHMGIP